MALGCAPATESAGCGTLSNGGLIRNQDSEYSQDQLELYLDKIGYKKHKHLVEESFDAPLQRLQLLMRLHLTTFPFENTQMHYSEEHAPDISSEALFRRFVVDGHGGSYCYGQNTVFMGILRRLGYRVYAAGARSNNDDVTTLHALNHMILFVQPFDNSPTTYLVDVGWGGSGQIQPILLSDHPENIIQGTTKTERHRLVKVVLPVFALPIPSWRLELTHNPSDPNPTWDPLFLFTEAEVYTADFVASSYALCCAPSEGGLLRDNVCAVKFYLVDPENPLECDIGRYRLAGRDIKRSIGKETEVVKVFNDGEEKERIASLKEYFGIVVGENGEKHIMDTPAHL